MNTDNNGTADSWKVRFSTGITGNWSYVLHIKDITGEYTDTVRNFAVTTSSSKGFIRKSAVNSHYFSYENCGVFWGIGHNNGYLYSDSLRPQCVENPTMNNMNQNGDNVLLFWINTPWRTPWNEAQRTPMENQNDGLLNYNQRSAKFIDDKLSSAENYGVKLLLLVWIHENLRASPSSCTGWGGRATGRTSRTQVFRPRRISY